jgi:hypothetical protein
MSYFEDLDNGLLNKYHKNLKDRKKIIDMFFFTYRLIGRVSNFM